jgi:nucleoside-diphosphate-sugar epimerase
MNFLLTGGLGLIGHNVAMRLENLGHDVTIVDNETTYTIIPQKEIDYLMSERRKKIKKSKIINLDISNADSMNTLFKENNFDVVIHLASFPRQKVVNANPMAGSKVMSEALLQLLELCTENDIKKFIYMSSSMSYGKFTDDTKEDAPMNPEGQYGIMKLAGEWLVKDYSRKFSNFNHVILRPSAIYGPLDVEDRVIAKFVSKAIRGETLKVNGADETLDFTYVDDAADGIVQASLTSNTDNKIYNITKSHSHTLLDAAKLAVKIANNGSIDVGPRDPDFPSRGSLNIDAAKKDFGFNPKVDIEEGFKRYYDWISKSDYYKE